MLTNTMLKRKMTMTHSNKMVALIFGPTDDLVAHLAHRRKEDLLGLLNANAPRLNFLHMNGGVKGVPLVLRQQKICSLIIRLNVRGRRRVQRVQGQLGGMSSRRPLLMPTQSLRWTAPPQ